MTPEIAPAATAQAPTTEIAPAAAAAAPTTTEIAPAATAQGPTTQPATPTPSTPAPAPAVAFTPVKVKQSALAKSVAKEMASTLFPRSVLIAIIAIQSAVIAWLLLR